MCQGAGGSWHFVLDEDRVTGTLQNISRRTCEYENRKRGTALAQTGKKPAGSSRKSGGANTTRRKNTKPARQAAEEHYDSAMRREVLLLLVLAVAAITALSNFGVCGAFGEVLSGIMFGVFGITAYVFPFYLFLSTAFLISNGYSRKAVIKYVSSLFIYLFVCLLLEMMFRPYDRETSLGAYYTAARELRTGGGFIGGLLTSLFRPLLGTVGSYILGAAVIIVGFVLITEKSVIDGVKKGSSKVYQTAKEDAMMAREASRLRNEEKRIRKEQRVDKKVKGVALAEIEVPAPREGEVHEITMEYKEADIFAGKAGIPKEQPTEDTVFMPAEESIKAPVGEKLAEQVFMPSPEPVIHSPEFAGTDMPEDMVDYTVDVKGMEDMFEPEPAGTISQGQPETKPEIKKEKEEPAGQMEMPPSEQIPEYKLPPVSLLTRGKKNGTGNQTMEMQETARKLQTTLQNFGVGVTVTNVSCGPSVTRYELQPEQGVKVSKIVSLADDIKLNLAAADIRIEAPIPGKAAVGIEVPNKENMVVTLRELLESPEFEKHPSRVAFAVGKDIGGQTVVTDIAKMPHLLIAGATGSGKSVCINTLIMSILFKANPDEVKLIMVDPKVVELSVYNGIPHLMIPVVTDCKKAAGALNWAVAEMTDRYKKFADLNVRDLKGYNEKIQSIESIEEEGKPQKLPQIIIIVDELADLMMVAPGEVEDAICRLAQLARAAGIHLVIATQRPSVNVITGLIKANVPSRIAFSVSSGVDSRTIIDMNGAEKLLGKGDMLFFPAGYPKPVRVQGAFVSDKEVGAVVDFLVKQTSAVQYNEEITSKIASGALTEGRARAEDDRDAYFIEAGRFIIEKEKASIGMLQRMFKIGFNRAARIMEQLGQAGVVGPEEGTKPRKILMTMEEFEAYISQEN